LGIFDVVSVGGGAAGFFAAITALETRPGTSVVILEQSQQVLSKVRISGGGRCNVTHACFDPSHLVNSYPRGSRELLGPFHKFGPADTVSWFAAHGVKLKTEDDGRMFPVSDDSETIVRCLTGYASRLGISILTGKKIVSIKPADPEEGFYTIGTSGGDLYCSRNVMIATGSSPAMWSLLAGLGLVIEPPVPSLFTFNMPKNPVTALMGITIPNVNLSIPGTGIHTSGPLLITHWGLSGPAVLKASAWGARVLAQNEYRFSIEVDWIPLTGHEEIKAQRELSGAKKVLNGPHFGLPQRLYHHLATEAGITEDTRWATVTKTQMDRLIFVLKSWHADIAGKTTFKEEFVTAGGIKLRQVNFKTFESRKHPGLFLAGEVLDIDAVTGGFNFQAAWTGGFLAGKGMATRLDSGS
jgi:predicted Rossmann fold flavoprotein